MKLFITGASGYIGKNLTLMAIDRGHDVVMASRQLQLVHPASWFQYDLDSTNINDLPISEGVVVHLAANTKESIALSEEVEVAAAQGLIRAAHKVGAKFIFLSSQTARADAPTHYGRIKWRIEQEVLEFGGYVVRPGLVYGNDLSGLYGVLVAAVRELPLLPTFIPAPMIQPIHVNDLVSGVIRLAESNELKSGIYCLASSSPINFSRFLREIANNRLRIQRFFIPVPIIIIKILISVFGEMLRNDLRLNRLRSLFELPVMKTQDDLYKLGLSLRPLTSGLHPSGDDRRRRLLREGNALLIYILKQQPSKSLLCRYVRAIESLRGGQEFGFLGVFLSYPILFSLLTKESWPNAAIREDFTWRMDAATILVEATPIGAVRFLRHGKRHGLFINISLIANALVNEVFCRLVRFLVSPLLLRYLARSKEIL